MFVHGVDHFIEQVIRLRYGFVKPFASGTGPVDAVHGPVQIGQQAVTDRVLFGKLRNGPQYGAG